MELIDQLLREAQNCYREERIEDALDATTLASKVLKEMLKLRKKISQKNSQKT